MKKAIVIIIFIFALVFCAQASEISIGLGYPYLSVKYKPVEFRYARADGINVLAGRLYIYFLENSVARAYTGVEAGHIVFNALEMKGKGAEGGIFLGGEYFITKALALSMDIAPTYIAIITEDDYKASKLEIVANISVNYYFSRQIKDDLANIVPDSDAVAEE